MIVLPTLIGGAAVIVLFPVSIFFCEVLLAATMRDKSTAQAGDRPRLAILVPAHNEESGIAQSLRTLVPQLNEGDRLLVVADNCSDNTAGIAAREGAEAIVRTDPVKRGKGYALDFGIKHLSFDAPAVVLVIDADCRVAPGAIDRLVRVCGQTLRPVQALYLMRSRNTELNMRVAEFAWTVKNQVRPLGLNRLGLPCQLMGTGMAFPWKRISDANLATGHLVEDLRLGIDLALAGTPALFCPDALVESDFPLSAAGARGQRTRWEHGHLMVIMADAPRLLLSAMTSRRGDLLALALDLAVPPLALLAIATVTVLTAGAMLRILCAAVFPLAVASVATALFVAAVFLSWMRFGRRIIPLHKLLLTPLYILWKVPVYFRFVLARQLDWVRSKRNDEES